MGTVTAARDFTDDAGKTHAAGEPVTGLSQAELTKRKAAGEVKEDTK